MWQQHVKRDVHWIQQHFIARIIVWEDRIAISKDEAINLGKYANEMAGIVRRDYKVVDATKVALPFAIMSEKRDVG